MCSFPHILLIFAPLCPVVSAASVDVFLNTLQPKYQWSSNSVKIALDKLEREDITTVEALAGCWDDVKSDFVLGMRKIIEKELKTLRLI